MIIDFNLNDHLSRHPIGCPSNAAPWANGHYANDVQAANIELEALEAELWDASQIINATLARMHNQPEAQQAYIDRHWPAIQRAELKLVQFREAQQVARDVADLAAEIWRAAA